MFSYSVYCSKLRRIFGQLNITVIYNKNDYLWKSFITQLPFDGNLNEAHRVDDPDIGTNFHIYYPI